MSIEIELTESLEETGIKIDIDFVQSSIQEFQLRHPELNTDNVFIFFDLYKKDKDSMIEMDNVDEKEMRVGHVLHSKQLDELEDADYDFEKLREVFGKEFAIVTLYILASKPMSNAQITSALWHELRHVLQVQTGRLSFKKDMIYWDGSPWFTCEDINQCYITYYDSPWEQDARIEHDEARRWYKRHRFWQGIFSNVSTAISVIKHIGNLRKKDKRDESSASSSN